MEKSEVFGLDESELKKWNVWIKIIKYVIKKMTIFLKTFFLKLNMRITDFVLSYNLYAQIWKKKYKRNGGRCNHVRKKNKGLFRNSQTSIILLFFHAFSPYFLNGSLTKVTHY